MKKRYPSNSYNDLLFNSNQTYSGDWQDVVSDVNTYSGDWNSVYTSVRSNSGTGSAGYITKWVTNTQKGTSNIYDNG